MKPLTTIAVGAAVLLGTLAAFGKNRRFLGDDVQKGDEAYVSVDRVQPSSPEQAAAAGPAIQLAANVRATEAGITVDSETDDTITGRLTAFMSPGDVRTANARALEAVGPLTVRRSDVVRVRRNGKEIRS